MNVILRASMSIWTYIWTPPFLMLNRWRFSENLIYEYYSAHYSHRASPLFGKASPTAAYYVAAQGYYKLISLSGLFRKERIFHIPSDDTYIHRKEPEANSTQPISANLLQTHLIPVYRYKALMHFYFLCLCIDY